MKYKEKKDAVVTKIRKDLKTKGRAIVRDLGTFKVVKHKAKITKLFGKVKAKTHVKFRVDGKLRKKLST